MISLPPPLPLVAINLMLVSLSPAPASHSRSVLPRRILVERLLRQLVRALHRPPLQLLSGKFSLPIFILSA